MNRESEYCIEGRRSRSIVSTGVVSGISASALTLVKDDLTKGVAGLTLLQQLGNTTGVTDLVYGQNAELRNKTVFEVRISENAKGVIWDPPKQPLENAAEQTIDKLKADEEKAYITYLDACAKRTDPKNLSTGGIAATQFAVEKTWHEWQKLYIPLKSNPVNSKSRPEPCPSKWP